MISVARSIISSSLGFRQGVGVTVMATAAALKALYAVYYATDKEDGAAEQMEAVEIAALARLGVANPYSERI